MFYCCWENESRTVLKPLLVVPQPLVNDMLTLLHDGPTAGHLGITKTLQKVHVQFYWPG